MKKLILIPILYFNIFLLSSNNSAFNNDTSSQTISNDLNIYNIWKQNNPLEKDSNEYYHFPYNPTGMSNSNYGTIKYTTKIPLTLVNWSSPDSFFVNHLGQIIGKPIINFSTYSRSDGSGQQLFYVYSDFIGDTLTIYGSINSNIVDTAFVIIK